MRKLTYSDAIKYLLDCHLVFPSELISRVEELITDKRLGYSCKEEFFYEAAGWRVKSYLENIEILDVPKDLYEQAEAAINEMDLPYTGVSDFIEEPMKKLHEQHDQWKIQKEERQRKLML